MGKRAALQLTPEQLSKEVDAYFLHCESTKEVRELKNGDIKIRQQWPSMPALALWLGISKESICAYARGEYPAEWINHIPDGEEHPLKVYKGKEAEVTKLYAQQLTRARLRIETTIVQAAASGDMDSKTASLLLNQFGYFSKQEVEQTGDLRVKWQGVDAPEADRYSK